MQAPQRELLPESHERPVDPDGRTVARKRTLFACGWPVIPEIAEQEALAIGEQIRDVMSPILALINFIPLAPAAVMERTFLPLNLHLPDLTLIRARVTGEESDRVLDPTDVETLELGLPAV